MANDNVLEAFGKLRLKSMPRANYTVYFISVNIERNKVIGAGVSFCLEQSAKRLPGNERDELPYTLEQFSASLSTSTGSQSYAGGYYAEGLKCLCHGKSNSSLTGSENIGIASSRHDC